MISVWLEVAGRAEPPVSWRNGEYVHFLFLFAVSGMREWLGIISRGRVSMERDKSFSLFLSAPVRGYTGAGWMRQINPSQCRCQKKVQHEGQNL